VANYDFCISQGSVATVSRWVGQNCTHLCQVSSWCCLPKTIEIGHCFLGLFKKFKWHVLSQTRCTILSVTRFPWTATQCSVSACR